MSNAALDNKAKVNSANSAPSVRGAGYAVYDPLGQKIGSTEKVFVNWNQEPEYVRVTGRPLRTEIRPDPGAVRRARRRETSPRPQVGDRTAEKHSSSPGIE
jgi:hypothetical protein